MDSDIDRFSAELYNEFAEQGFPRRMMHAFQDTANRMQCVIMTRTPGPVGMQLIDERYDLKGFGIHSKSCNWGPMAGFLCMTPHFNKSASSKIEFNQKHTLEALGYMAQIDAARVGQKISTNPPINYAPPEFFPPIIISAKRMAWLRQRCQNPKACGMYVEVENGGIVGIAHDLQKPGPTVAMEFAVMPAGSADQFRIWHGNIYFRKTSADVVWTLLKSSDVTPALQPKPDRLTAAPALPRSKLQALWEGVPDGPSSAAPECEVYPVRGIRNAYPPYLQATDTINRTDFVHKNAVTGDYDLFAVWPLSPLYDLQRTVEKRVPETTNQQPTRGYKLFGPVPHKPLSLAALASPSLIVEFIPEGDLATLIMGQGKALPEQVGNTNDLVNTVAQTLNSFSDALYNPAPTGDRAVPVGQSGFSGHPNAAFHGDEGGRPDVDTIGFEDNVTIGAFFPSAITTFSPPPTDLFKRDRRGQAPMIIRDRATFAGVLAALRMRCVIGMHFVWLHDLLKNREKDQGRRLADPVWTALSDLLWPGTRYAPEAETVLEQLESLLRPIVKPKLDVVEMSVYLDKLTGVWPPQNG